MRVSIDNDASRREIKDTRSAYFKSAFQQIEVDSVSVRILFATSQFFFFFFVLFLNVSSVSSFFHQLDEATLIKF